jgi:hypothetical protein
VPRPGGASPGALPPLPEPLADTSRPFQQGFARALELLKAPGPSAPPEQDAAAAQGWLDRTFKPWLEQRLAALVSVVETFSGITPQGGAEPPDEHVVAVAMLGLSNGHIYDQLMSIPPPAAVRADEALLHVYQSELQTTLAGGLLQAAVMAHRQCASSAAQQRDAAFGPWLALCEEQLALRTQQQAQALALRESVRAQREAERHAAEGERPAGPQICWAPVPAPPPELATPAPALAAAATPPSSCALPPAAVDPQAGRPLTPRDQRYGARDPESGVRVSVVLGDNPTMDARPLGWLETQTRLARCFAQHVPAAQAITISVHASLSVGAYGKTQSVVLTPEPSDAAAAPSKALSQCLQRALKQTAFACSPGGQPTQASAVFCMRRD